MSFKKGQLIKVWKEQSKTDWTVALFAASQKHCRTSFIAEAATPVNAYQKKVHNDLYFADKKLFFQRHLPP